MLPHDMLQARVACVLIKLQKLVCRSDLHLDVVPEVNQILADGNKRSGIAREQHVFLTLCIEDAPHLAIILQLLHVTTQGLLFLFSL